MSNVPVAVPRVGEIDALRGLAALAVMLFHYTSRIDDLFPMGEAASIVVRHGHYGVNLFFIISGYVIFMTLQRTRQPLDFVVSRFSRLFPAYWVAVVATLSVTHALGLPGKLATLPDAVANFMMIHAFFGFPHVDGVYWTLEVELLFYAGMFSLYRMNWLNRVHTALWFMLALRLTYFLAAAWAGVDLPWKVYRFLILEYIPWFALGIAIYLHVHPRNMTDSTQSLTVIGAAVLLLALVASPGVALLAAAFAVLVLGAATGRLGYLAHPVMVWLGAISYTLYLLHENIGWSVLLRLRNMGVPRDLGILLAIALSFLLATLLSHWVERPAMNWMRGRYSARKMR